MSSENKPDAPAEQRPPDQERIPTVRPEYDIIKKERDRPAPRPADQDD